MYKNKQITNQQISGDLPKNKKSQLHIFPGIQPRTVPTKNPINITNFPIKFTHQSMLLIIFCYYLILFLIILFCFISIIQSHYFHQQLAEQFSAALRIQHRVPVQGFFAFLQLFKYVCCRRVEFSLYLVLDHVYLFHLALLGFIQFCSCFVQKGSLEQAWPYIHLFLLQITQIQAESLIRITTQSDNLAWIQISISIDSQNQPTSIYFILNILILPILPYILIQIKSKNPQTVLPPQSPHQTALHIPAQEPLIGSCNRTHKSPIRIFCIALKLISKQQ